MKEKYYGWKKDQKNVQRLLFTAACNCFTEYFCKDYGHVELRVLLHAACMRHSKDSAFRRSLSQWGNLGWPAFGAALPACLEPRGDGFRASLGTVCTFPTSQGR